ncbi:TetR family transcriptional regulator [Rothia sp. LK2588]|uniref:TetR/AcrR family transcriptional regulator n=1 Tax=Rothia sp. LK2588 TaxID=3114369 RepID=UPI0034CE0774
MDSAFNLLTQYGLADLSMRRLATELGVAPGALYYHVKNKQQLLASLASRMLENVYFEGPHPAARLQFSAEELYRQLSPVRESAEVIRLALALNPSELKYVSAGMECFSALDPEGDQEKHRLAAASLLHACMSIIEEEQTRALLAGTTAPGDPPDRFRAVVRATITGWSHPAAHS